MLTIIDYGSGNLRSVQKAFERIGALALITDDPQRVAEAERIVLPGVGAFGDAMGQLHARGLVEPILAHIAADRPFFGICMGLQLLFETGWEGGQHRGLAVLGGDVARFELPAGMKVPHMGWNTLAWHAAAGPRAQPSADWYYFVHSYVARPSDPSLIAATADYGGDFCAAVVRGRLFATQFHPEKSQAAGMRLLQTFLEQ
ncbi:MAG: imidazole glycerol phosphate synthase subunit HisH [Planctomycetota bacterium]|nr:MAG: imidazole glycerol phosphate synthase subunit HisH [Planctomycetota bacterium]